MIHILDFNDNIIDFISRDDGAVTKAEMTRNVQEMVETFDFTILSERADNVRERNRVIAQDYNGVYREFIITHVEDDLEGLTDIKCNASYLEDLATAKPLKPQTFEKMSTTQALLKTLADTGWEVSDETEYGGMRSKSWTSYNNPYQVIGMLETAYDMVADFYIELGSHTVEHRYVSLKHPNSLFKGKEIVKGKDLTGLTRTVDTSEVRTALIALGPEDEQGNRISTVVKDDDAHEQFGLPGRYLWDIYEPESEDTNMTLERLTTLAKTELNKRKQMSVSYEISALDIHRYYNDVQVELRDKVRVKDRDFNPPLYVEAEVLAFTYNLILDDTTFTFGNVVEFEEDTLRQEFTRRLDEIRKKLQDDISNVNTIVNDAVEGQLEYFEPKIIKSDEAPEKPVEDMLWYDTSNSNVAVLRRYVNGEWRNETAKDVEQLGGMTREKVLYNSLTNTFANLNIQHSKLLDEVYKLLNNEYLVDDDLRLQLDNAINSVINVYNNIKTNLDSMTPETATIGKLIDTQALFLRYRERLQDLYKAMRNAQIAADDRLKLLQSQYTDEKFNDAMNKIAKTLPNGRWDSENQRLYADIPNRNDVNNVRQALQEYTDGQVSNLNSVLGKEIDSKINTTKSEISASISSVERKIDGIEVGGRNLIRNSEKITDYIILSNVEKAGTYSLGFEPHFTENIPSEFGVYYGGNIDTLANDKPRITHTFEVGEDRIGKDIRLFFGGTYMTHKDFANNGYVGKVKLEYGNFATDYTLAPEDLQNEILVKSQEISKAQADAAETRAQAYADSKITNEEQARIRQADANLQLLQQQQQSLKDEMAAYTDNLINEEERARIDADAAKEEALKAEINLAQTQANAYADNKITAEEERAIKDAQNKFEEAKKHAEEKAAQAQSLANEYAKAAQENAQNYANNKINNLNYVSRNLLQSYSDELNGYVHPDVKNTKKFISNRLWATTLYSQDYFKEYVIPNETYTIHYEITIKSYNGLKELTRGNLGLLLYDYTDETTLSNFIALSQPLNVDSSLVNNKFTITKTFKMPETFENDVRILSYAGYGDNEKGERVYPTVEITNLKLEKGDTATDWTPAPEDYQRQIKQAQQDAQEAAQAYANAQDELKETNIKAYADGIVSDEEKRAIADAENKLKEAKTHAEETAEAARKLAEQNASIDAAAKAQDAQENAQTAAEAYAKAQDELKETKIKAYADDIVSEEEQRAIQDAENKLKEAKSHAEETAEVAQQLAQNYALTQAQTAQTEAEKAAKAYADAQDELKQTEIQAYADGIVSDEEQRAIADAIAKRDEAKEYAEQKAQEAQEAANQNTSNQLKPITTRVTKNEANITELDNQISLMAKSDDVAQKLRDVDGRLTPLETTVESNKATLDILPTQIESKVSKQDYTLDKNEIVQRLDNADSQRKQLSNEITDKVTITKFESGMTEAKNYTDNIKKETKNYTDNQINNLDVGSENLLLDSESRNDGANNSTHSYIRYYLTHPLEIGKTYTLKADIVTTDERQSGQTSVYPYYPNGTRDTVDIKDGKITYTFTAQSESTQFLIYKDVAGQSNVDLNVTIEKAILVEGDKVTGWSPANQDVKRQIQQSQQEAEKAAKEAAQNYAKAQDELKETKIKAYADDKITAEEKRAIADAESKLQEAKSHAEKTAETVQQTAQNYTNDEINNLDIGSENLLLNSESRSDFSDSPTFSLMHLYLSKPLEIGKRYTFACDFITNDERQSGQTSVYPYYPNGTRNTVDIKDGKITYTFTAQAESTQILIYKDVAGQSNVDLNVTIEKAILVEGDKVTGWAPANQDVKRQIQQSQQEAEKAAKAYADAQDNLKETQLKAYADGIVSDEEKRAIADAESKLETAKQDAQNKASAAQTAAEEYAVIKANDAETNAKNDATTKANKAEANAKAYTDKYKQSNDVAMTKLETSISQLDGKVSIKVDEQKFNASQETLSKVLTEIAATTSGINLTYDNNGAIQGVTVDNGGVKLRGDKVDITVNDEFRVMANRVDDVRDNVNNKVGKDEIINRLNLSPEGLDIDVNRVGIRGGGSTNYVVIKDDEISLFGSFQRTWRRGTETSNVYTQMKDGHLRFRNNEHNRSIYMSDFGISTYINGNPFEASGTLAFFDYTYDENARGVTLHSGPGVVAMRSENNRAVIEADNTVNIGSNKNSIYFRPNANSRVGVNEFSMYVKLNDTAADTDGVLLFGEIYDTNGQAGSGIRFKKKGLRGETNGEYEPTVYATNNNGDIGTGSFYAHRFYGDWIAKNTNLYAAVDSEFRVVDKKVWNGGNPNYMNIRFQKWYAMSSEKFKYDIKPWNYSVLDAFRNDLQLYSYKHKSEQNDNYIRNHHGVIIEREMPIEWRHGDGVDGNEITFWNSKAIQELIAIVDKQNGKINELEEEVKWLKTKI
mgnify:CR=1 FL=1